MSDSLPPHGPQHARLPCPSPAPGACSNLCPSVWWCHPIIASSVVPFSSCPQSFPASGSFPVTEFFSSGGQSIGASAPASVLPMNIQSWFPVRLTGLISLQSKGLSRVFSSIKWGCYEPNPVNRGRSNFTICIKVLKQNTINSTDIITNTITSPLLQRKWKGAKNIRPPMLHSTSVTSAPLIQDRCLQNGDDAQPPSWVEAGLGGGREFLSYHRYPTVSQKHH